MADMRKAFINTLMNQAKLDDKIWLLVADVGFNLVEPFQQEFPDRFINVGIAEQAMIGIASGLAMQGKKVFCYSLGNFPTLRCLEQIRNDVCYHNLDVKIVSSGAGLTYGTLGSSHHATEDIAVMRALPNMIIESPCDLFETELAAKSMCDMSNPFYLRLTRASDEILYQHNSDFEVGKARRLQNGKDIAFLMHSGIVEEVMGAVKLLENEQLDCSVYSVHTIKPIDINAVYEVSMHKLIVVVEEHNVIGGLGSAVAEVLACNGCGVKFKIIGIPDKFIKEVGSQQYLRKLVGLTSEDIANKVKGWLK